MAFNLSKSIVSAASAGLMLGALSGCAEQQQKPAAAAPAGGGEPVAESAKACCKGLNECKGKGGCRTDANDCAGKNDCKGKGGCNGHCPK